MKWFKHDSDASMDAALQDVLLTYGAEGYGCYWYCVELIAGTVTKDKLTFELEHDARIIARNLGISVQKVEEMMKHFVAVGLFQFNATSNKVLCLTLAKRLDDSMRKGINTQEIVKKINESGLVGKIPNYSGKVPPEVEVEVEGEGEGEGEDKNTRRAKRFVRPTREEIQDYMQEREPGLLNAYETSQAFFDYYQSNGWKVGRNSMKDWKASVRNWLKRDSDNAKQQSTTQDRKQRLASAIHGPDALNF